MLNRYIYEDKTLEKAFEKFYKEHNLTKEDILYTEKVEKTGLLKTNKTILEIILKDDLRQLIVSTINNISIGTGINIEYKINIEPEVINIECSSDNSAALIGKNGKMLNSLQLLLRKIVEVNTNLNIRINLDIEDYKKRKINSLEREVKKLIKEVLATKIDIKLDPMNSYERRIVHNLVSNYEELTTESEGESPNRYVVIKYREK